jgi:hypothetical protein
LTSNIVSVPVAASIARDDGRAGMLKEDVPPFRATSLVVSSP